MSGRCNSWLLLVQCQSRWGLSCPPTSQSCLTTHHEKDDGLHLYQTPLVADCKNSGPNRSSLGFGVPFLQWNPQILSLLQALIHLFHPPSSWGCQPLPNQSHTKLWFFKILKLQSFCSAHAAHSVASPTIQSIDPDWLSRVVKYRHSTDWMDLESHHELMWIKEFVCCC